MNDIAHWSGGWDPRRRFADQLAARRATRSPLLALALALALLAGCGSSDDKAQVRSVVSRFYAALEHHQLKAACAQLSEATIQQLEDQASGSCEEAIGALGLEPAAIATTEVYLTNARVQLRNGDSAFLGREPGGWKLSALGCKPEEDRPANHPMDCSVEV